MKYQKNSFILLILCLALGAALPSKAQVTVSGTVTDAQTGNPLLGVNILVKGTSTGTVTDADGHYSLSASSLQDTLRFSYIGYQTQTIPINGRQTINVSMKPTIISGEQLVVVGFGTQREQDVTGSIAKVTSQEFNSGQISNPAGLIQGKVAGLQITKAGSNPNGGYSIHLRGINTLGVNSSPLIVLNGVPGASLNNIDPNDIESMSVLKDASASAIYGTRGSNGVILITTKSGPTTGEKAEFSVEYQGSVTMNTPYRELDVMSADQYRNFLHSYANAIGEDLSGSDLGHSTDWYDEITRTGINQQHYLALSGGNSNTNYRASLNYRNQKGILKNTGFEKVDARLNLNQSSFDGKLLVNVNLTLGRKHIKYGFPEAFRFATTFNPTAPIRSDKPKFDKYGGYFQQNFFTYNNPVAIVENNENNGDRNHLRGNIKATYTFSDFIPGLSASLLYSEQHTKLTRGTFYPSTSYWRGAGRNGLASRREDNNNHRLIQTTVHYKKSITRNFHIKLLGGYSWQKFTNEGFSMTGGDFITNHFGYNNMGAAQEFSSGLGTVGSYKNSNKLIAGYGRVNLRFNNTYLLTGSVRREGSSRFGANNKWGTFYSISGGIRLANLFNLENVQELKLRAGYGVTGNDAPQDYLSKLRYGPKGYFLVNGNWTPTYGPVNNPNADLKWEKKVALDIGLDFSLLDSRLGGSLDFYTNKTKNLLLNFNVPVPPNLYSTEWINIGELSNKGMEIQINYKIFQTNSFQWSTGLTGSLHNRTKIVNLSSNKLKFGNQQVIDNLGTPGLNNTSVIRVKEGKPIGQIWGKIFEGITKDGRWKFKNIAPPDTVINKADNTVIGEGQPIASAGWQNTFNYKNWTLSFFFQGVFGHDLLNTYRAFFEIPSRVASYNVLASTRNVKGLREAQKFSSFYVENASFVKLQNATIGYTVPLKNSGTVSSIRFTLTGQNLFIITGYSGSDPAPRWSDTVNGTENPLAVGVARRDSYFNSRRITFGIDIKF